MNPEESGNPWSRLTAAARQARPREDASAPGRGSEDAAPHGFATRVAALAFSARQRNGSLLERFAFRAVGAAGLLAALSVVVNYPTVSRGEASPPPMTDDIVLPVDDAIAAVLDFSN